MAIGLAFRAFFAALSNSERAERLRAALESPALPTAAPAETKAAPSTPSEAKPPAPPARSDALTLLSTLQREARFLDLVQESLDGFDDAQVGAAAREVVRDCRKTLDRMFGVAPLADEDEGATLKLQGVPPARVRLVGKSEGESGTVAHRGWKATRCEVPTWSGSRNDAWILAPIEVDVA